MDHQRSNPNQDITHYVQGAGHLFTFNLKVVHVIRQVLQFDALYGVVAPTQTVAYLWPRRDQLGITFIFYL